MMLELPELKFVISKIYPQATEAFTDDNFDNQIQSRLIACLLWNYYWRQIPRERTTNCFTHGSHSRNYLIGVPAGQRQEVIEHFGVFKLIFERGLTFHTERAFATVNTFRIE